MKDNSITINGVMLNEFIKDKELVSSQVDREKLLAENTPAVSQYKKPRNRYRQHWEENGECKIMGQVDVNIEQYKQHAIRVLKNKDLKRFVVVFLLCQKDDDYINTGIMSKKIERLQKENNLDLPKNITNACRYHVEQLEKTQLGKHMYRTDGRFPSWKIIPESKELLTIQRAFNLANLKAGGKLVKYEGEEDKVEEEKQEIEVKEPKPIMPKYQKVEKQPADIMAQVLPLLEKLEHVIKVDGDLNIHIHVGGKS